MKKTRILAFALAVLMLCTLLAGCSDGDKTVMKVGGKKISKDIFTAAIAQSNMMFEQNYGISISSMLGEDIGDGRTGADFLKEQAESFILEAEAIRAIAEENGIELTAEDDQKIKETKDKQIEAAGDRKTFIAELEASGSNEAFYDYMLESVTLYSKINTLFAEGGKFAVNAENIANTFSDYFCVKHILIMAKETDRDFESKKKKAEKIAERAKNGEDFEALIAEYGEDPGMESYTGGYLIDAEGYTPDGGAMVAEFSEASVALEVGGVSDVVKTDYGFHIIKRYPMSKEHIETDLEGFTAQVGNSLISKVVADRIKSFSVERTKHYDTVDVYEVLGVEKTIGADAGVAESHEGHDHSAEGAEAPEITLTPAE